MCGHNTRHVGARWCTGDKSVIGWLEGYPEIVNPAGMGWRARSKHPSQSIGRVEKFNSRVINVGFQYLYRTFVTPRQLVIIGQNPKTSKHYILLIKFGFLNLGTVLQSDLKDLHRKSD